MVFKHSPISHVKFLSEFLWIVVNKSGALDLNLTAIAAQIVTWCEARSISLSVSYLSGSLNSIADKESRSLPDAS